MLRETAAILRLTGAFTVYNSYKTHWAFIDQFNHALSFDILRHSDVVNTMPSRNASGAISNVTTEIKPGYVKRHHL
jgi:hypothetical protein